MFFSKNLCQHCHNSLHAELASYVALQDCEDDNDMSLPVEFTRFDLSFIDGRINLDWHTASEINNDGFEVQRAFGNDTLFTTIGTRFTNPGLAGLGTSPFGKHYSFTDVPQQPGTYSYRLVDVSTEGIRTVHPSKSATIEGTSSQKVQIMQIAPDPARDRTVIRFKLDHSDVVNIELYSSDGKCVARPVRDRSYDRGEHSEVITFEDLAPGTYFLKLSASTLSRVGRLVVVR